MNQAEGHIEGLAPARDRRAEKATWQVARHRLIAYAVVAGLLALALTLWVIVHPAWDVDTAVTRALQGYRTQALDSFMHLVGLPGFFPQVIPLNGLFILILYLCRLKREALTLLILGPLVGISSTLLRYGIDRPRPSPELVWMAQEIEKGHFSFPSGHTFGYTAILGFIMYIGFTQLPATWHRNLILSLYAAFIILVGISRVYEGEHWLTDVVGGYLFGSIWLVCLILFYHWLGRRQNTEHRTQQ